MMEQLKTMEDRLSRDMQGGVPLTISTPNNGTLIHVEVDKYHIKALVPNINVELSTMINRML